MKTATLIFKTLVAAITKASAALIAFFMTAAITRLLGPTQAGLFLLALSILSFCSVFFRLGLDSVIIRLIGADRGEGHTLIKLSTGLTWSISSALIMCLILSLFVDEISLNVFSKPEFSNVLLLMIWALPFTVVFMLLSCGFQGYYRVVISILFQNLGVSTLFLLMFLLNFFYISEYLLNAEDAAYYYLYSSVIVCIAALYTWNRQINGQWGGLRLVDKELWASSSNLWVATSMTLAVQWSGILIAGVFTSSAEVAYLAAAQRTATLISFVLMVVNMVVAPRYALLWKEDKINEIQRLAKWSTRGMLLLALPLLTFMLVMPDFIMALFGEDFIAASGLLAILAVGQFTSVATGSVGYLLNMSNHESDYRKVTMFVGPLTVILNYLFILKWGVIGAAFATSIGLSLQNIGALFMVRKRLGFWPIG